ncbi:MULTISPECIES: diacylglycerol kinase [unclassified Sphingomonas]|uniref:diacylglycerol kinase n=1 Tax=unclassified Sphingomonas TaxID=196159 RepID=UPI0021509B62|nr:MULTISPECIES: diacylglycerol kinase [unclassified Sphingomonas]MCR5872711.1 diacylglycerol kinase [Sphingomonas sp. J344]UUX99004.1 diacylglycerol kinase [Sphingomonas sp. J315]
MKNPKLRERVGFALAGWHAAWLREASFRTQAAVAIAALIGLIVLRPAPIWWAIVAVTVALVLALELINSALEAVIDPLHPGIHPEIKAAKDMLAGAVLMISVAAVAVGAALLIAQSDSWIEWLQ